MKNITIILSVIVLLDLIVVPASADTTNDTDVLCNEIPHVCYECGKIKPGMTRAELIKLQMFVQDRGPDHPANDKTFEQHPTFEYRGCPFIKVDVDFGASSSKEAQPTDVITKVSLPYLDARQRVLPNTALEPTPTAH